MLKSPLSLPRLTATRRVSPPRWALMQRFLFDQMAAAADAYVEKYCRPDGALVWRDVWPGMDGSDDGYEAFTSFPLLYLLGGNSRVHEISRHAWDAVTKQFTRYGQIHNEFDAYYDWMHHGESSLYFYFFGLADPTVQKDRQRALRFAGLYMGDDPEAANWDNEQKLIRSPINGSRGPRFEMTAEDWVTHREILATYLSPYEDASGMPGDDPLYKLDWNDDNVFMSILDLINQRMARGDVPLNLTATSLITNAFCYEGDDKYRAWVLAYLDAWRKRTNDNDGIMPDNVGLTGQVGEHMDGKWWGGYYGWRWPHGAMNLLESSLIAGSNALLLTGDASRLDLVRSQLDLIWSKGEDRDGVWYVPKRYGDVGWFDYVPADPRLYIMLHDISEAAEDAARLAERFDLATQHAEMGDFGKGGQFGPGPWRAYVSGVNPGYPEKVLDATWAELRRRLDVMAADRGDPASWDVHHWQDINPVLPQGLLQLTCGTPGFIYHGGMMHTRVRYFDPLHGRAGLPDGVAALVESVGEGTLTLSLVNTDAVASRPVIVQAGAFAEHDVTSVSLDGGKPKEIGGPLFLVELGASSMVTLDIHTKRHTNAPTYQQPV